MIRGVGPAFNEPVGNARDRNYDMLQSLALFKRSTIATDDPKAEKPPQYEDVVKSAHKSYTTIEYTEPLDNTSTAEDATLDPQSPDNPSPADVALLKRCAGKFTPDDEHNKKQRHVWIECKPYVTRKKPNRQTPLPENVKRV